jgi:hypothetical protein
MSEFMMIVTLALALCWGLKQYLGYLERQRLADMLARRPGEEGRPVTSAEIERYQATVTELWQPPDVKKKSMNKWLVIGLCALYIICPIDFIPDVIPVLGWGDDLAAAIIAVRAMFS